MKETESMDRQHRRQSFCGLTVEMGISDLQSACSWAHPPGDRSWGRTAGDRVDSNLSARQGKGVTRTMDDKKKGERAGLLVS